MSKEGIPYEHTGYRENISIFSDTAKLILENYGKPAADENGRVLDAVSWKEEEIMTDYSLSRFNDGNESQNHQWPFNLVITNRFPNGEVSKKKYTVEPVNSHHQAATLAMTTEESERVSQRAEEGISTVSGVRILRPQQDPVSPEHEIEFLVDTLRKGLEILAS